MPREAKRNERSVLRCTQRQSLTNWTTIIDMFFFSSSFCWKDETTMNRAWREMLHFLHLVRCLVIIGLTRSVIGKSEIKKLLSKHNISCGIRCVCWRYKQILFLKLLMEDMFHSVPFGFLFISMLAFGDIGFPRGKNRRPSYFVCTHTGYVNLLFEKTKNEAAGIIFLMVTFD